MKNILWAQTCLCVCLSVASFLEHKQHAWLGANIAQQWDLLLFLMALLLLLFLCKLFLLLILLFLFLFLGLVFAGLDIPLPPRSQVKLSKPQEKGNCPRGDSLRTVFGHFRLLHSLETLQVKPPPLVKSGISYLTPVTLPLTSFSRILASLGPKIT